MSASGPLAGLRVVELAGIGPAPFCAMMLADLGADVLRVDRADAVPDERPERRPVQPLNRGRRSIAVDLKHPDGAAVVVRLAGAADVLVEGFRPGVAERLGVGPGECRTVNPRLVYGRVTGYGQEGPLANAPGHDLNYLSIAGVAGHLGPAGSPPVPPLNLIADFGGGGMLLAVGILAALHEREQSGQGQVVDAAMIDGAAAMMGLIHGMWHSGSWTAARGGNILDGGAHFYRTYETSDGRYVSIAANEPQFYRRLVGLLGLGADALPPQMDRATWPEMHTRFEEIFRSRTQAEWCDRFAGEETCFAPVLTIDAAAAHEHNVARQTFTTVDGVLQASPAPRFDRTPGAIRGGAPYPGEHTGVALREWGWSSDEIAAALKLGAVRTLPS